MNYSREDLFNLLEEYEIEHGCLPTRDGARGSGFPETPFRTIFGGYSNGKLEYEIWKRNKANNVIDNRDTLIEALKKNLSEDELKLLVKSSRVSEHNRKSYIAPLQKECFKFIATGDSHIGHNLFNTDWWNYMVDVGIKENVDWMYHSGDILEGMSGRPGHVYELAHIGFEAQFGKAKSLFKEIPFPIKAIEGNHDGWGMIKGDVGVSVGARLEESLDNFVFMGHQEADDIIGGIKIKLWHGNDGSCFDDTTEIQTRTGWKLFKDLLETDEVATMTKEGGEFQWQTPTNIYKNQYSGEMVHFKSRTVDSLVTPNHGMWTKVSNSSSYRRKRELTYPTKSHKRLNVEWHRKNAGDIFNEYSRQKWEFTQKSDGWVGCSPEVVEVPYRESKNKGKSVIHLGNIAIEDMAELISWYVTEGHARTKYTTISQHKNVNPENHNQIEELANRLGINYGVNDRGITLHSVELAEYLKNECGHLSRHKFLPTWLKDCDRSILRLVFETMIKGDGWVTSRGYGYKSISKQLRDDFGEICSKLGYAITFVGEHTVNVRSIQVNPTVNTKPQIIPYEGMVYCCEVPNGLIFVRRNGKTLWTHNSYAYSYRTQKFVEMLTGGEKPNILLAGHAHKSIFYETRNVHVFETGTTCGQTGFMRGKKLAAHCGFWVVTCYTDGESLTRIIPEWYPLFK